MKLALLLSVMSVGVVAFATGSFDEDIRYESWCEGDQVMKENEDGAVYTLWDCYEISKQSRCVETTTRAGKWTIVNATCN